MSAGKGPWIYDQDVETPKKHVEGLVALAWENHSGYLCPPRSSNFVKPSTLEDHSLQIIEISDPVHETPVREKNDLIKLEAMDFPPAPAVALGPVWITFA